MTVRIATSAHPNTTERVELGGVVYTLRLLWSERAACWHLTLGDADGVPIVSGMRVTAGYPLLARYRHLTTIPPGELALIGTRGQDGEPTLDEMGSRYRLYYFAPGELSL